MAEQEATHHNNDSVQQAEESTQRTTTDREDRERQIRELHQDESVCQEGSTATPQLPQLTVRTEKYKSENRCRKKRVVISKFKTSSKIS